MKKQFYEKALPRQGVYCITSIDVKGKATNRFAETVDQLLAIIDDFEKQKLNVFVTPNTFKSYSRMADNALYARSFFIDLDVGDDEKKYASQSIALDTLNKFVEDRELPPPVIINSGGGVHAYWIFDEDIPIAEWKPYARKFKALCLDHLLIDPKVTADAARVMRCPDSLNYKTNPPKPTGFFSNEINEYDFGLFKQFLGTCEPELEDVLALAQKGLDNDTLKLLKNDNFDCEFQTIVVKSLEGDGCNQIKYIIENSKTLSEPMWYAGLSIARACVDWEEAIHLMSEDHPGYDRAKTIAKAEQTVDRSTGKKRPHGCEQFEDSNPGGCDGCPHRGKITNPLPIGKVFKEAPTTTDTIWQEPVAKEVPKFPEFLKPYVRGASGGVYFMSPPEKDEEGKVTQAMPINIFRHDIYPLKRMYSPHDGDCLQMRVVLPHDNERDFLLPMSQSQSPDQLKSILPRYGASFDNNQVSHVMRYIKKWDEYMKESRPAEQMRMQMGWTEDKDAFVIGTIELLPDGTERPAPSSPFVKGIAKLLKPFGSYADWQKSFNALNAPGYEMHAFGGLIGFGSVLMNLTSTSGAVVCFHGDSGVAKTGALYACLSIWGQPKELSVFDATDNGMVGRYLALHNLPLGCDEVSNKKADQLSNLIHRISHGKAKIRMQASVNAEREYEYSASLLSLMTTNQPIYDKLAGLKGSPDGEMARLIEFTIGKPFSMTPARGREIFDAFRYNYGWAGPEFIKYYFKVGEAHVRELIDKWSKRFSESFGDVAAYRFYENTITSTFAAGEMANAAGIIKVDLDRIYKIVVAAMCAIRDETPINNLDYKSLVGEFVHRNQKNFLVLNDGKLVTEPFGPLVGRTEIHTSMRYISKTELRKFLAEYQVSVRQFEHILKEDGMLQYSGKQRLSNGWKAGQSTPPIAVYGFKMEISEDVFTTE